MANKMLIDASHPEETRVVVVRGNRVEEFDFESASRRPLRGNIYLAKVTRVEPSLQAAFVEYGGNRHGFLAFSEIHPDYYQIPVADRQALLQEQAEAEEDAERDAERGGKSGGRRRRRGRKERRSGSDENVKSEALDAEDGEGAARSEETRGGFDENAGEAGGDDDHDQDADSDENGADERPQPEHIGGGDALDDVPERPRFVPRRSYKIQEVIKRRQILLVQVVKEERGNKGAALTTYLSLAGRYSVLMPNTGRGGGISRKITSAEDRKRLREIATELEVPDGMGIILRTAGASRTKAEIKRDYEYLMRLWESVRELTLESTAPALVYEEGSLIKRSIRDLYNKDIDEVICAGDNGYREAKDFMKMLMPSHAKAVKSYKEPLPLFARYGVDSQLDAMFGNQVTLKSGGYLVMNQTEALVSIDVNSGRSTREHNIEDTALKTNLEAAEEVARQLRLRDLAGLIVIDFIDMEEKRNNRSVEKKLKDCLKNDRARIQVGHISPFGLMEMSRQRIRTGVLESSTVKCAHCDGSGFVRSTPSVALQILRGIEEALIKSASHNLIVKTRSEVALYVLNQKRSHLSELEMRFGVSITINVDDKMMGTTYFHIERGEFVQPENRPTVTSIRAESVIEEEEDEDVVEAEAEADEPSEAAERGETAARDERQPSRQGQEEGEGGRRRRRRRRRRRGGARDFAGNADGNAQDQSDASDDDSRDDDEDEAGGASEQVSVAPVEDVVIADARPAEAYPAESAPLAEPKPKPRRRGRKAAEDMAQSDAAQADAAAEPVPVEQPAPVAVPAADAKPARAPRARKGKAAAAEAVPEAALAVEAEPEPAPQPLPAPEPEPEPVAIVLTEIDPNRPKRGGWWSRK